MPEQTHRLRLTSWATLTLFLGLLSFSMAASTMELGRLFYSPHERHLMDRARVAPVLCLSMKGVVLKAGLDRSIWIAHDGRLRGDGERRRIRVGTIVNSDGSAKFWIAPGESALLRPGETLDVIRRETRDAFDTHGQNCPEQFLSVLQ